MERERQFITTIFEREASQSLREITTEVEDLLAARKSITPAAYAKMKARYDEVLNNAQEHMENLQLNQDSTAAAAEVAHNSLTTLMQKMLEAA